MIDEENGETQTEKDNMCQTIEDGYNFLDIFFKMHFN